ncbi:MAG: hypothetical protein KGS61_19480, partial [Verrucomicrobia bacterium]|nr:hypothetical protein [Verrucomicrobiota bacterium]
VYGGAVQMFGRAYRGGATKDLALRMKSGQQLVFGEQIGWFDPDVISDTANADFLRDLIQLRWRLRRYFYAGQMARPPKFDRPLPTVTADWQWSGTWPVTTDAVLAGAWELPREHRLVLLFVNVSEAPVTAAVSFDPATYGLAGCKFRLTELSANPGDAAVGQAGERFAAPITFPARQARVWEWRW